MSLLQTIGYFFLGIVQGLTEPLPISSKGHVLLFNNIFGIIPSEDGQILFFLAIVHLASLLSITIIFRHKIQKLFFYSWQYLSKRDQSAKTYAYTRYLGYLLLAFVVFTPIAFLLGETVAPKLFGESTAVLAVGYIITSGLLIYSDFYKVDHPKTNNRLTRSDAVSIGLSQVLAIIPGVSRSGTTLVAGLLRKLDRDAAIEFSFFLFIPTILGANLYYLLKALSSGLDVGPELLIPYIFAFIGSFVATFYSFKLFIHAVKEQKLSYFAIYTIILALLLILNPGGLFSGGIFAS